MLNKKNIIFEIFISHSITQSSDMTTFETNESDLTSDEAKIGDPKEPAGNKCDLELEVKNLEVLVSDSSVEVKQDFDLPKIQNDNIINSQSEKENDEDIAKETTDESAVFNTDVVISSMKTDDEKLDELNQNSSENLDEDQDANFVKSPDLLAPKERCKNCLYHLFDINSF